MAKIPEKIGKYKIDSLIAKGGMGAVFKGVHPTLHRHIILKKLTLRGNSAFAERFKREARIMMDFKNDHIVDVYDHFKEGQSYYIVLEYVNGTALDGLLKDQRYLPNDVALLIFLDACKALNYAHNKNVIHRDIKPGNILISKEGEVKLVDFGIATSKEDEDEGLTKEGMTLGTPSYMAPEQFQNTKNVDKRADIYSMGVMLYEMVTGKKPYPGNFSPETLAIIQKGKYKPPHKINPKVSGIVKRLIKKTMHSNPKKRFQDLDMVITYIRRYLKKGMIPQIQERLKKLVNSEPVEFAPNKKVSPLRKVLTIAGVSLLCLGAAIGVMLWQNLHYELLFGHEYGTFKVQAKIRISQKPVESLYFNGKLFKDDGADIPEMENVHLDFKLNNKKSTDEFHVFESQKVYVKSDHYRLKINYENDLIWNAFFLNPRMIQSQDAAAAGGRIIEIVLDAVNTFPIEIDYKVKDQLTGKSITYQTDLYFYKGNTWVKWNNDSSGKVLSGNVYKFNFYHKDYYQKSYTLFLKPFQKILRFDTALIPLPGKAVISGNVKNMSLRLDNSEFYRSGEKNGIFKKLKPLSDDKAVELILQPGTYRLTAGPYEGIINSVDFEIAKNTVSSIKIEYDKESKIINVITK